MTSQDLRNAELSFAYEHAGGMIEGLCVYAGNADGNTWYDLSKTERDISKEIAYLESRGLLQRHPLNPAIARVRGEDELLAAAEGLVQ